MSSQFIIHQTIKEKESSPLDEVMAALSESSKAGSLWAKRAKERYSTYVASLAQGDPQGEARAHTSAVALKPGSIATKAHYPRRDDAVVKILEDELKINPFISNGKTSTVEVENVCVIGACIGIKGSHRIRYKGVVYRLNYHHSYNQCCYGGVEIDGNMYLFPTEHSGATTK